jgi:hypothetical protein
MSNSNHKFHIDLPKGWLDQSLFVFSGPDVKGQPLQIFMLIDRGAGDLSLEEYAGERIDATIQQDPTMEVLKRETQELPSGTEVFDFVGRSIPAEGETLFKRHVYLIKGDVGYVFTANFNKKTLKTLGVQMMQIIDTLRPLDV